MFRQFQSIKRIKTFYYYGYAAALYPLYTETYLRVISGLATSDNGSNEWKVHEARL